MMKKGVIFFEGNDEQHFLFHIIKKIFHKNYDEYFDKFDGNGYNKILSALPLTIRLSDGEKPIGVIMDSNSDITSRWQSLSKILRESGYSSVPPTPHIDGIILTDESLRLPDIGIWLMPDNSSKGMLEDFIMTLIPENDDIIDNSKESVNDLIVNGKNRFKEIHRSKAEIHTWLAWQEEPGTPMGQSITKEYLNLDKDIAQAFIEWLNNLFKLKDN